jgi:hypothetical protein
MSVLKKQVNYENGFTGQTCAGAVVLIARALLAAGESALVARRKVAVHEKDGEAESRPQARTARTNEST